MLLDCRFGRADVEGEVNDDNEEGMTETRERKGGCRPFLVLSRGPSRATEDDDGEEDWLT